MAEIHQEFQFTYSGKRWQGVAGAYFMKSNAFNEFDVLLNASGGLSLYTLDDIDTKTWAIFGDISPDGVHAGRRCCSAQPGRWRPPPSLG